jgi:hypothetical protein
MNPFKFAKDHKKLPLKELFFRIYTSIFRGVSAFAPSPAAGRPQNEVSRRARQIIAKYRAEEADKYVSAFVKQQQRLAEQYRNRGRVIVKR